MNTKKILLVLLLSNSFIVLSQKQIITQNIYTIDNVLCTLEYIDSQNIGKILLSVSENYKSKLTTDTINSYTFTLYNTSDLSTFTNELNNACDSLINDDADYFTTSTMFNAFMYIQTRLAQPAANFQPLTGTVIYNSKVSVEMSLDAYIKSLTNEEVYEQYSYILTDEYNKVRRDSLFSLETHADSVQAEVSNSFNGTTTNRIKHYTEKLNTSSGSIEYPVRIDVDKINQVLKNMNNGSNSKKIIPLMTDVIKSIKTKKYVLQLSKNNHSKLVFEDGTLSDVQIILDADTLNKRLKGYSGFKNIIFENKIPFGSTSKKNYQDFSKYYLYDSKYGIFRIKLSDILTYQPNPEINTRDYSPADTSVSFKLSTDSNTLRLMKSRTKDILDIQLYSDFIGVEKNKPNGLIQTELSYRINTNSFYKQFKSDPEKPFTKHVWAGVGYLSHVTPYVAITKIEKDGRSLPLGFREQQLADTQFYAQRLQILEYNNLKVGVNGNLLSFTFPGGKTNWQFWNYGFEFGRTSVTDSSYSIVDTTTKETIVIPTTFGISTIQVVPFSTEFNFLPEYRFRFDVKYSLGLLFILNDKIKFIKDINDTYTKDGEAKFKENKKVSDKMIHLIELRARYKLYDVGFFFARYRLYFQNNIKQSNFHQAQLGFSLNIFSLFGRKS